MKYIYKIQNLINNKVYIGQTKNFKVRFKNHRFCGKQDSDYPLYHEMFVYGIDKFDFSIIEYIDDIYADDRERYWISYYNSFNKGYNQQTGGANGFTFNEKSKHDISESNKGKTAWNKGKTGIFSEETLKHLSESHKNISEETRQKMRNAKKNYIPWNKGNKTNKENWDHCWVVNENGDTTRILITDLQKYIDLGYKRGRKYK